MHLAPAIMGAPMVFDRLGGHKFCGVTMGHLIAPADAPLVVRLGLDAVLWTHIGGGTVGMASGAVAMVARKGGRVHRTAGNVFFVAMLGMAGVGAVVSPMLNDRVSTVAGFLTLYLVLTGWLAARHPPGTVSRAEMVLPLIPLGVMIAGAVFIRLAAASPDGMVDGQPPAANFVFAAFGLCGLVGDGRLILRRGLTGAARTARHLWRMGLALLIAMGSFFLGQPQVFPKAIRHSGLLPLPVLICLLLLLFWLGRTWWIGWRRRAVPAAA